MAPPRRPPRRPTASARRARAPVLARLPPPRIVRVDLIEDPHSHIVCRVCGRIQRIELNELDRHLLTELAAQHPDGWNVDGVAFSLTGACQRCREGPSP
jgi:Fe2+ or Zn2+ uptake regulation protein